MAKTKDIRTGPNDASPQPETRNKKDGNGQGAGATQSPLPATPASSPQVAEPADDSPLGYMLGVMRDEMAEEKRRDGMAKAAAAYLHPKAPTDRAPSSIKDPGKALHDLALAARETLDRKLARLAQSGKAPRVSSRAQRRRDA